MRMLIQTQLSNYDTSGKFILECDSGWQMVMGRVREMLRLVPDMEITVMGPWEENLKTPPEKVNPDLFTGRVAYLEHEIIPNALATRYDFDIKGLATILRLGTHDQDKYDWVYINDPMHLRNFRAMFYLYGKYMPKFAVHSHFIDNPSCPKFPTEASLWLGQVEAAIKADVNFWQCQSALDIFKEDAAKLLQPAILDEVMAKSFPWDDGYSSREIHSKVNEENLTFWPIRFKTAIENKVVLFVPNRVGGRGRSSDYTNVGKFLFEVLPELRKIRQDFVVIAGNPSQKFTNQELLDECGPNGLISVISGAPNRDEYKYFARHSQIAVGLYNQDTYGGTAARELVDAGLFPLWLDNFEYASIAREAGIEQYLAKPDFSDLVETTSRVIDLVKNPMKHIPLQVGLRSVVRGRCAYEATTGEALRRMGIL